jgi:hypothetical protein
MRRILRAAGASSGRDLTKVVRSTLEIPDSWMYDTALAEG